MKLLCFRPLDGESFSKRSNAQLDDKTANAFRFRPLDGESFSKRGSNQLECNIDEVSVP